jgi:phenylalanyl-tRNA synthetase beta chain
MKVPLGWLKEFVDVAVSPRELADALTLVGLAVDGVDGHGDAAVLDIDVTTNRVDCMNVFGVAREVALIYRLPLRPAPASFSEAGPAASEALAVEIQAPDLCTRFCARVLDVRVGPSPGWIRDRLESVGIRAINNIVDLSNYVMIEMGQPTHAFDLARLPDARLVARWARDGEALRTLDGVERRLGPRNGVVAGGDSALAVAGVMGGAASEVSDDTKSVALEAAHWDPLAVRRSAKSLAMHTEASHRFERAADPEGTAAATARLAHLLEKIGAGTVRPGLIDVVARPQPVREARLRPSRVRTVLGVEVPPERQRAILEGLGFVGTKNDPEAPAWRVPSWRGDVAREVDLIEEVGRHFGVDRIPSSLPASTRAEGLRQHQRRERAVRDLLTGVGLSEVINYDFVSSAKAAADPSPRVAIANPLSSDQDVLRSSLAVPGLLENLATNLRQGRRDVALFEIGRTFAPRDGLPLEERRLGIVLLGEWRGRHWSGQHRAADFYDAKGILEAVGQRLGTRLELQASGAPPFLHPGRAARISADGTPVGWLGVVHPEVAQGFELRGDAVAAEIVLEALLRQSRPPVRASSLPRFPEVTRDLSVAWGADRQARELLDLAAGAAGERLVGLAVVDRYAGPGVPEGRVSLTITLRFQDLTRTLTGEEVQEAVSRVVASLKGAGAEIRGE